MSDDSNGASDLCREACEGEDWRGELSQRYAEMPNAQWFRLLHEGKSISDDIDAFIDSLPGQQPIPPGAKRGLRASIALPLARLGKLARRIFR